MSDLDNLHDRRKWAIDVALALHTSSGIKLTPHAVPLIENAKAIIAWVYGTSSDE